MEEKNLSRAAEGASDAERRPLVIDRRSERLITFDVSGSPPAMPPDPTQPATAPRPVQTTLTRKH